MPQPNNLPHAERGRYAAAYPRGAQYRACSSGRARNQRRELRWHAVRREITSGAAPRIENAVARMCPVFTGMKAARLLFGFPTLPFDLD